MTEQRIQECLAALKKGQLETRQQENSSGEMINYLVINMPHEPYKVYRNGVLLYRVSEELIYSQEELLVEGSDSSQETYAIQLNACMYVEILVSNGAIVNIFLN